MSVARSTRRALKRGLKTALYMTGSVAQPAGDRSLILTYHSIGTHRHEMTVSEENFRAQMDWLHEQCNVTTLERAAKGQPGVAITFDDGYRNNLTHAAPILAEKYFPATVFMVAGRAGETLDGEQDPEGGTIMTWDEVRELEAMGIEIGSHTMTHPHLAMFDAVQQQTEIADARKTLEEQLGHAVTAFAYPYGSALDYNECSVELVRSAGYRIAVTNRYGTNHPGDDPWRLHRIWIDATDTLDTFAAKVDGRLDGLRHLDSPLGIHARRALNRLLLIS